MIPTIEWHENTVRMIDQRKLPAKVEWYVCRGYRDVDRRHPENGDSRGARHRHSRRDGAFSGRHSIRTRDRQNFMKRFETICADMRCARPTAVNLGWAVDRMKALAEGMIDFSVSEIQASLRKESEKILVEDIEINRAMGMHGEVLVPEGATVLTHCNAGSLATGGYGTALGVIRAAHEKGKRFRSWPTRPDRGFKA